MTARLSWRSTSQPNTQLYRQWGPICQEIHRWTSGRGKYSLNSREGNSGTFFFSRSHVLFLPPSIDGCSPANSMTPLKSFLCLSTQVWDTSHMCTLHHFQAGSITWRIMEGFQGLIQTWKIFQAPEKLVWNYGKLNTDFGKICFLCLSASHLVGRWDRPPHLNDHTNVFTRYFQPERAWTSYDIVVLTAIGS